jgi:hypothetical protein
LQLKCGGALFVTYREHMQQAEREYVWSLLREHRQVTQAAKASGLNRTYFYRLIGRCGRPPAEKQVQMKWGGLRVSC